MKPAVWVHDRRTEHTYLQFILIRESRYSQGAAQFACEGTINKHNFAVWNSVPYQLLKRTVIDTALTRILCHIDVMYIQKMIQLTKTLAHVNEFEYDPTSVSITYVLKYTAFYVCWTYHRKHLSTYVAR